MNGQSESESASGGERRKGEKRGEKERTREERKEERRAGMDRRTEHAAS